jgi:putative ABC transport system permease protein
VAPADGTAAAVLVDSIDARSDDLQALTRDQAADDAPGVSQVRQSFQVIFLLYALVVPFVTGLFFLIVTVQKAGALTLLRAIGAPGRRLVAALLVQVVVIVGLGLLVGIALYTPLTLVSATALGLRFETAAVLGWSVVLLVLGLVSSLLAARRVLAIDPVMATAGAGLR